VQMTMTLPCRLMMRHRSHITFTEGRTFIVSPFLYWLKAAKRLVLPTFAYQDIERPRRYYTSLRRAGHGTRTPAPLVRILGPPAVIATVCSKCAASDPSAVEIDQSSSCT
jgi:hypothetical protein